MCGRWNNDPSKYIHILSAETCEYVTFHGLCGNLSGWPHVFMRVLIKGKEEGKERR